MKLENRHNYTVFARSQSREEDAQVAHLYEGVYFVSLNQLVRIYFVPWTEQFNQTAVSLPPDLDYPSSVAEARLWMTGFADMIVTYQDARDGEVREMSVHFADSDETERCVLFLVTQASFALYVQELKVLAEQLLGVYDFKRYEAVKHLEVVRYLERAVLSSWFVPPRYFGILKRPFPHLISQCINKLTKYNQTQSHNIYHGYFCRRSFLENCVWGDAAYECALLCPMHTIPDKSFLPNVNKGRDFWRIQKSKACADNFHTHLLFGISIWLDRDDDALLQVELFKFLRDFDDDWDFEISTQRLQEEDTINYREQLTFAIDSIAHDDLIKRIIDYLAGTSSTF